ncbi:MAG: helicase-related protein [Paracoccaceae bacterium]
MAQQAQIVAVLGPTNTGKTHYAIERMLGYRSGVIGLPLRLLAREVYDKIVALRGPSVVALVTGEERLVPARAQYWVCTVEAMPQGMGADFVAIDEIQLCADPERGHVFTDRLLHMRGAKETLFLGSDTMRGPISALVPQAEFLHRKRLSTLSYSGSKKISRMPPRSAIVGFSVEGVYAIAELIRRQKGGAAVVMGALSPRTRNAQVELYQNGEVDYLVATDAIGMGLNLDVHHVAFSALSKFDGRRMRALAPNELAQIAGRAGRGMADGSFGVTGEAPALDEMVADAIMEHRFAPLKRLQWRNSLLQFGSPERLISSLEQPADSPHLFKAREADDLMALKTLTQMPDLRDAMHDANSVQLLWDVCRVPDFRGLGHADHTSLLAGIFTYLHKKGTVPDDWFARQINRIDKTDGDIDTLSNRLAFIRTWTYVAQRSGWVHDENHWRGATRAVEDRLSDALHERLTQRFVDRRTSVLLRRLKQKEALLAEVNDNGEVTVEGEFVGRLEGFRFRRDKDASGQEAKAIQAASLQALVPHFHLKTDRFYNAPDTEMDFTDQGGLMWGEQAVGKLMAGDDPLKPKISAFVDEAAGPEILEKVERRLQHFIDRKIAGLFDPLLNLQRDETLNGLARGFAFRLVEGFGLLPRAAVAEDVKALDQDARASLRKHGIRFGQFTIFMPLLLKPAPTRLRLLLWSLAQKLDVFPESPPPGLVTVPTDEKAPKGYDTMSGYRIAGARAIRIDMLERLADLLRVEDSRNGFEAKADMLSITGMTLEQFADLMQGLGYSADKGEREKVKAAAKIDGEVQPAENTPKEPAEQVEEALDAHSAPEQGGEVAGATDPNVSAPASDETGEKQEEPQAGQAERSSDTNETPDDVAADGTTTPEDVSGEPEKEVFYTFKWGRRPPRRGAQQGAENSNPSGTKKPNKRKPKPKKRPESTGAKKFQSRPEKKQAIDPDNPFAAALMGLKTKE